MIESGSCDALIMIVFYADRYDQTIYTLFSNHSTVRMKVVRKSLYYCELESGRGNSDTTEPITMLKSNICVITMLESGYQCHDRPVSLLSVLWVIGIVY